MGTAQVVGLWEGATLHKDSGKVLGPMRVCGQALTSPANWPSNRNTSPLGHVGLSFNAPLYAGSLPLQSLQLYSAQSGYKLPVAMS